jgi:DNA-binding NarL/FixJ family response regulator
MSGVDPIRVAVIDDDRSLLEGLVRIIDAADGFCCVGAFTSAEDAFPALRLSCPDVTLLDIQLPGVSGDEAIGQLRSECPNMQILMLTVFSNREKVFTSICNGAHGYLLKSTPPARLLEAIRAAREGGWPISPEIARHIVELFQTARPPQKSSEALAPQESRLLSLLAEGYSYEAAAEHMNVSVNTIRNYIRSIYTKLHVHSKSEAVSKALRQGLIG